MKRLLSFTLLLAGLAFAHAADKYAPSGNTLADALQWLAVLTACRGQYNNAEIGIYNQPDARDIYRMPDIGEYLARQSGNRTATSTIFGVCFDYAQLAYNTILASQSYYAGVGVREWYIAADGDSSRDIRLYDPAPSRERATVIMNGVPLVERSRQNVQYHPGATNHAWLWVIGNDGTIYWIDPTWTDGYGYVVWGVVRNGREEQVAPNARLCAVRVPGGTAFVSLSSGDANKNARKYEEAIVDYNEAIRLDPDNPKAYNNRGLSYYHKRDYDRAIADFDKAISLDSGFAEAYHNRGLTYFAKSNMDKALADYSQALALDPGFALAYNNRARVYMAKSDYEKAYADAREAVKLVPKEAVFATTRGEIYLAMKSYDQAITVLRGATTLAPSYAPAKELLERARKRGK